MHFFVALIVTVSIFCGGHGAETNAAQYDLAVTPAELPFHSDSGHDNSRTHVAMHSCHGTCHMFSPALAWSNGGHRKDGKLTPIPRVPFENWHPQALVRPPIDLSRQPLNG
ncbi:hypothetical protein [Dongia sp.]|uniref:hypothetical protein n=1 Tax=Dongia sp. TaxID=1977262 RepID=UPI0035B1C217